MVSITLSQLFEHEKAWWAVDVYVNMYPTAGMCAQLS